MTCVTVHHQVMPWTNGHVAVMRIGCILEGAETVTISKFCITMMPVEARHMASAMRDTYGHFLKEDGDGDSVEVWREPYEADQMTWKHKDGEEVCEPIYCYESDGDGWSWEFARALDEAADKAEAGE